MTASTTDQPGVKPTGERNNEPVVPPLWSSAMSGVASVLQVGEIHAITKHSGLAPVKLANRGLRLPWRFRDDSMGLCGFTAHCLLPVASCTGQKWDTTNTTTRLHLLPR